MSNLSGIKVLITRPAHQSEHLCQLIAKEGGVPVRLPVIDIVDIDNKNMTCRKVDIAIFISANAVEKTLPTLGLPTCQVIAVGKRTAKTLKDWGVIALCSAPPFNSETVLAMPQLQSIAGKKIVIFRGEGGRELLADSLRQRGAIVNYINVYRRVQSATPKWLAHTKIDIITVTSVEGLKNLLAMLNGHLKNTPLVVMSTRISVEAEKLGIQAPIFVAPNASDEGLLKAVLKAWSG